MSNVISFNRNNETTFFSPILINDWTGFIFRIVQKSPENGLQNKQPSIFFRCSLKYCTRFHFSFRWRKWMEISRMIHCHQLPVLCVSATLIVTMNLISHPVTFSFIQVILLVMVQSKKFKHFWTGWRHWLNIVWRLSSSVITNGIGFIRKNDTRSNHHP